MKLKFAILFLSFLPCLICDAESDVPKISFGTFPYPISRIHFYSENGTPISKAKEMYSPFPDDFPSHTIVTLEDSRDYPALKRGARYFFPSFNRLRIYNISDLKHSPYKTIQKFLNGQPGIPMIGLVETLRDRPKSSATKGRYVALPDYPSRNAAHLIQTKIAYADYDWGSGVFYITQFTQSRGNYPNNEELVYLFQGLSKDGKYYVSADFRITHPKLPRGIDSIPDGPTVDDDVDKKAAPMLSKQKDDSFTPSLDKLRTWVGTLKFEDKD